MRNVLLLISISLAASLTNAQNARLVLNDSVWLVGGMYGGFIVLDNPNSNAITLTGNGKGGFVSEDEDNKIRWNIGTNSGLYHIPFYSDSAKHSIPVTCDVSATNPGQGSGRIDFSTYSTKLTGSNTPYPSMVTDLLLIPPWIMPIAVPEYAVDRFWLIDATNYMSHPDVVLSLSYVNDEVLAPANSITPSSLRATQFDDPNGEWTRTGYGVNNVGTTTGTTSNIVVPSAEFFPAWTLVDQFVFLPVELTRFETQCHGNERLFYWETATETNNNFFILEKSWDGTHFFAIDQLPGAGTSTQPQVYSSLETEVSMEAFYRLAQVDFDGTTRYSEIISGKTCTSEDLTVHVFPNPSQGMFNVKFAKNGPYKYRLLNLLGDIILQGVVQNGGQINLSEMPSGTYLFHVDLEVGDEIVRLVKQ